LKRRSAWLLLALALFGLVAWMTPRLDGNPYAREAKPARFPRYPSRAEYRRMNQRRTLVQPAQPGAATAEPIKRDPLLVAMPPDARTLLVLEAKAFLQKPIGRMLVACAKADADIPTLEKDGFDLDKLDRTAVVDPGEAGEMFMLSGAFAGIDVHKMKRVGDPQPYGRSAQIYAPAAASESSDAPGARARANDSYVATWNDEIVLIGKQGEAIRAAIDRLEGRAPARAPFDQNEAYGELYGRVTGRFAPRFLPNVVADKLQEAGLDFMFHLDASKDALLVVDASGTPQEARDVGRTLAAALAARRVQAISSGETNLARLLDLYSVRSEHDGFQLEAAFPLELVEEALGKCAKDAAARDASSGSAGSAGAR
jgi:hypothetical protein